MSGNTGRQVATLYSCSVEIILFYKEDVMVMYQIQDKLERAFHSQDLVLWHAHVERRSLPIPAVVVRQDEHDVIIRAYMEGKMREVAVSPDELVER
jgi:hypothetical protein